VISRTAFVVAQPCLQLLTWLTCFFAEKRDIDYLLAEQVEVLSTHVEKE